MAKRKSNVDLVKHMMDYSETGAIAQIAIVEAITRYAKECAAVTDQDVEDNSKSIVSYAALRRWGLETEKRMAVFYKTNKLA